MFHGSLVALVTPMQENGEIDFPSLTELVEWHIQQGTHGIVVMGTTGESGLVTEKESLDVISHVVDLVNERVPVIAGSFANRTEKAVELTRNAMEAGVDACLIMTPAYIKPTQEGLYLHYKTIAEAVHLPLIVYNVPGRTACDLLPETLERLSTISNIIGVKEATGSLNRMVDILDRCGESLDIYSGDDETALSLMLHGAKGVISVTANVAPALMSQLCEAALSGDREKSKKINQALMPLHKGLFVEANPIPVKWALHQLGLIPPGIRLPLTPLSEHYHPQLKKALEQLETFR